MQFILTVTKSVCLNPLIIREELQLVVCYNSTTKAGLNPLIIREELQPLYIKQKYNKELGLNPLIIREELQRSSRRLQKSPRVLIP